MQKKYLELLFNLVKEYKTPKMVQARIRDGFLREISPVVDQFFKDRNEIYIKFCDKKEDGEPDIIDNKFKFNPELLTEINEELNVLGNETVEIKFVPEIKNFIEESSYETKAGETLLVDEIIAKI